MRNKENCNNFNSIDSLWILNLLHNIISKVEKKELNIFVIRLLVINWQEISKYLSIVKILL